MANKQNAKKSIIFKDKSHSQHSTVKAIT